MIHDDFCRKARALNNMTPHAASVYLQTYISGLVIDHEANCVDDLIFGEKLFLLCVANRADEEEESLKNLLNTVECFFGLAKDAKQFNDENQEEDE